MSGTARARVGYAPGNWLFYATGGFAWSYDQFTRTQLAGVPVGGTAQPGQVETLLMVPRIGGAVGAGIELALAPNWVARLEYLYTDYGSRGVTFTDAAQRFDSDLAVQTLRLGLDYRLGSDGINPDVFTKGPAALDMGWFAVHGQTTFIEQYAAPFRAPYSGVNSLASNAGRETWDAMLAVGFKLWQGAELWIDPEIDQGFGLSNTEGVAGFPSGAAFKIGASVPYPRIQRTFVRQTIDLGGETQKVEADLNQFAGSQTADRLVITVGKFSVSDVFDTNKYAQNPRKRFHELGADRRRHLRLRRRRLGLHLRRGRRVVSGKLDAAWRRCSISRSSPTAPSLIRPSSNSSGSAKSSAATTCGDIPARSRSPVFSVAAAWAASRMRSHWPRSPAARPISRLFAQYRSRGGVSMNLEQEITSDLGVFMRAGWADGNIEPYEYHRRRSHRRGRPVAERASNGAGPTTLSALPASSTAFPASTRPSSTTAASASSSATACCRIPVSSRSSKPITATLFPPRRMSRSTISSSSIPPTTPTAGR